MTKVVPKFIRRILHGFGEQECIEMTDPSGDLTLIMCADNCGRWGATYRGEPFAEGLTGLDEKVLDTLSQRLSEVGRIDLSDHIIRIKVAIEQ